MDAEALTNPYGVCYMPGREQSFLLTLLGKLQASQLGTNNDLFRKVCDYVGLFFSPRMRTI